MRSQGSDNNTRYKFHHDWIMKGLRCELSYLQQVTLAKDINEERKPYIVIRWIQYTVGAEQISSNCLVGHYQNQTDIINIASDLEKEKERMLNLKIFNGDILNEAATNGPRLSLSNVDVFNIQ